MSGGTVVIFKVATRSDEKTSEKVSGIILNLMEQNPEITIPEMAEHLKKTPRTIERIINKLKADKVIDRIGPAKGGRWEVIK